MKNFLFIAAIHFLLFLASKMYVQSNNVLAVYGGQCGGLDKSGTSYININCKQQLTCYYRNQFYAECRQNCPFGWTCQGSILELFKLIQLNLKII